MPAEVKLSPNIPLQLALADPSGVPEDFRVHFPTSDGRVLTLPRQTAIELNLLDLRPGEAFCICKDWDGTHGKPATYRIWLPAATEQERAAEEAEAEPEPILPQPLTVGRGRKPAKRDEQPRLFDRGTGTYGPEDRSNDPGIGLIAGAGLGAALGGFPGAVAGGIIGLFAGLHRKNQPPQR